MIQTLLTFINEPGWSVRAWAKLLGLALVGIIVFSVVFGILGSVVRFALMGTSMGSTSFVPQAIDMPSYRAGYGGMGGGMAEVAYDSMDMVVGKMASNIAMPSIAPMPPMGMVNGSRNAEKFERTEYSAQFSTRAFVSTCDAVEALKPREYVLFDSAQRSTYSCWYSFRVEVAHTDEVLFVLKELRPDELSTNVHTVAQAIEDTTDRIAALKRQRTSVEETLAEAERAYDDAIRASRNEGIVGLGSLVTEKLSTVERLTNTKLSLDEQIRAYEAGKTSQLDDTAYTHFSVQVSKVSIIDWKSLAEMWRTSLKQMVYDVSTVLSSIVLMVPVLVLKAVWFMVVALVTILSLTMFARLAWSMVLYVWHVRRG
jgi:hypothetical protein